MAFLEVQQHQEVHRMEEEVVDQVGLELVDIG